MNGRQISSERLVALFVLGALLLNAPFLIIFDKPVMIWGMPLLYIYIFTIWAGLIACTACVTHFAREPDDEPAGASPGTAVGSGKPANETPQRREIAHPPSSANSTESSSSC